MAEISGREETPGNSFSLRVKDRSSNYRGFGINIYWKNLHKMLASLGITGDQLRNPLKSLNTIVL